MATKNEEITKRYELYYHEEGQNIIYVGTDQPYFNTIKYKTLKPYEKVGVDFHWLNFRDYENYEHVFIDIVRWKPIYVYLDFSVEGELIQKIGKLLTQDPVTSKIPIVAIVNNRRMAEKVNFYPYMFVHFKGGEHHDVIFDPFDICYPETVKKPEFAKAKFNFETTILEDIKVGYITPKQIHAEGNLKVAPGQIIEVETAFSKKLIPSKRFFVRNVGNDGLYYKANYFYDFEFQFADEPEFNEKELDEAKKISNKKIRLAKIKHIKMDRQERIDQYHNKIEHAKREHLKWIEDKMDDTLPRKFKMLIVDPEMCLLRYENDVLSNSDYNYRFQSNFTETFEEIMMMRPQIICINLWDDDFVGKMIRRKTSPTNVDRDLSEEEEEVFAEISSEVSREKDAQIAHIIKLIKSTNSYRPIVVIFNSKELKSSALQKKHAYQFIMSQEQKVNSKYIETMANAFDLKIQNQYQEEVRKKREMMKKMNADKGEDSVIDVREKIVYVGGEDPLRKASIAVSITIQELNESEIYFTSDYSFKVGQKFRIEVPVPMYITISLNDGQVFQKVEGAQQYRALIHGVDEVGKKYIRKFVNEVIFSPLMAERDAEVEAFKKLNETAKKIREEQDAELQEKEKEESEAS